MNPFIEVSIPNNITPGLNFTIKDLEWEIPSVSQGTALFGYGDNSDQVLQNWELIKQNYKGTVDVEFEYHNYPGLSYNNQMKIRIIIP